MKIFDKESVENKLFRLKQICIILEETGKSSKEDFLKDYKINSIGMFNLMVGITIILDVGQHFLTRHANKTAQEYKDIVRLLGEYNIIPLKLSQESVEMAKFRNLLVHDYDKIEEAKVYDYIQKAPDIFRQFARYYIEFMDKQKAN